MDSQPQAKRAKLNFGVDQLISARPLGESQRINMQQGQPLVNNSIFYTPPNLAAPQPQQRHFFAPAPSPLTLLHLPFPPMTLPPSSFNSRATLLSGAAPPPQFPPLLSTSPQIAGVASYLALIQLLKQHTPPFFGVQQQFAATNGIGSAGTSTSGSSSSAGPSSLLLSAPNTTSSSAAVDTIPRIPAPSSTAPVANILSDTPTTSRPTRANQAKRQKREEAKVECPKCHKKFLRPWLLNGHERTHSGEKPYKCRFENCGRAFADRSNWRAHEKIHSDKKDFCCERCGRRFKLKPYLRKHMKFCGRIGNRARP